MHKVEKVTPLSDYKLRLVFDQGEERMIDFSPYLDTGIYKNLKRKDKFEAARINYGTVEWDDDIDICPEFLYEHSKKI